MKKLIKAQTEHR